MTFSVKISELEVLKRLVELESSVREVRLKKS